MEDELHNLVKPTSRWAQDEAGKSLQWAGKYKNFEEALEAVNRIGAISEAHQHHPDIRFGWGYVQLRLTTHDAGGLTQKDFELADALNSVLVSG
ncbi:MAG: 4a-hydroxytetrahydrobiopterin dehydratase [Rickettsiales bacterium]|nr:4a-hydroxytetrahydrobiopterin dehydratase [Rickettsiales bacterium]